MPGTKMEVGFAGAVVADTVRRQRERLGLSFAELSRRLVRGGRDIPPLGLRRIETAERRVDVDDLLALAVALEVSPATLLMPAVVGPDVSLEWPPDRVVSAKAFWNWLNASYPLYGSVMAFYSDALPPWERDAFEDKLGGGRS